MPVEQTISKPSNDIAVTIPVDVLRELKWLAETMGVTPSIALRHAIAIDSYIQTELQKKSSFLVKKQSGSTHEISWADSKEIKKILDELES
jgi:hypothetical protein